MAIAYGSTYTSSSGNSGFRVCCNYTTETNARNDKTVYYYYYVEVTKGDFVGTDLIVSWSGGTVEINGVGTYGQSNTYSLSVSAGGSNKEIPSANAYYLGNTGRISTLNAITISANPIAQYTHTISHYLIGFNGENNTLPSNPNHYVLGTSSINIRYGDSININDYVKEIPNGFYLKYMWDAITNYYSDSNYTYTQTDNSNTFNFYYFAEDYNITYTLNGGTNNTENPSSYNVLYGVTLKEPTRQHYTFTGWTDQDNTSISAINEGANAEFDSVDEMYNHLSLRTTGDITLTANWIGNEYTITLDANGGTSNTNSLTVNYDSNTNSNISAYIPTRKGYEFLGWYSSTTGGTQIYDCNGICTNEGTYWSDNIYVYAGDLTVYAHWKPLNIAYIKQNGKWVLCNSYVKKNGTWNPAIMKKIKKGVDS